MQIGPNSTIQLRNATAPTHAFIVVLGYFAPTGTLGYTATNPARILNTQQSPGTRVAAGATVTVSAPTSVPSSAKALVVNVMAFSETGAGYLTLSPDGSNATATLNYASARTRANSNIVVLNSSRQFKIFNGGSRRM